MLSLVRRMGGLVVLALLAGACGLLSDDNQGFEVPPFEDIEPIAFEEFPGAVLISESISSESSSLTIDSSPRCTPTGSFRTYEFVEPVLFSEIQTFYNDIGLETGWEIVNTQSEAAQELFHPTYVGRKEINGRVHDFRVSALEPDGVGNFQVVEDEPVVGFDLQYSIRPDPDHPFC